MSHLAERPQRHPGTTPPAALVDDFLRGSAMMDASPNAVDVVDRDSMRVVFVNQAALAAAGCTREAYLDQPPHRLLGIDREALARDYDQAIAAGAAGTVAEVVVHYPGGRPAVMECRRRALRVGDRWFVLTVSQDIGPRRQAERAAARLSRMLATLGATNEAIMRAPTAGALYEQVCRAAVDGGRFEIAAVLLPDGDDGKVAVAAVAGTERARLEAAAITLDDTGPAGRGLVGTAFRTGRPGIANDFLQDPRTAPWHAFAARRGIGAAAAVPLIRGTSALGVLLLYAHERGSFDHEIVQLLERMAENVVFGLDNFAREAERQRAEQAARAGEARYRDILESIQDAYYEVDLTGSLVLFNAALVRLLQYPAEVLMGMNNRAYMTPADAAVVAETFKEVYRTGRPVTGRDWHVRLQDGSTAIVEGSVNLAHDLQGRPIGFRGILRDVTEHRRVVAALRHSEARFRALTGLTSDWYWEQDTEFRFTVFEGKGAQGGYAPRAAVIGRRPWELPGMVQGDGTWDRFRTLAAQQQPFLDLEYAYVDRKGRRFHVSVHGEPMFDDSGRLVGYRGTSRDITERKRAEQRIRYLATHDALTGLPNRETFNQMLAMTLESARRYERQFAVLFVDLDRFKIVNDTLGHEAGDTLLREMSARFRDALRASDVVARLGGDEFVMLIHETADTEELAAVARKILAAGTRPVEILGQECRVTASVGIARFPADADDATTLLKNADSAMYLAKSEGKNNFQFYNEHLETQSRERIVLESNLRHALDRGELSLHYQGKLDLRSEAISGVEALLRWHNPQLGAVAPMQFIPLAEETGLIVPIGLWVLRTACAQNVAWQRQGLPPVCMSVNLSPRQFLDPALLDDVAAVLAETGLEPRLLELEITEGMVMHDTPRAVALLTSIRRLGVRIAIDDFGTGYSSLALLKSFPIDTLKVDRSFIREVPHDSEDRAITEAIIAMGKSLSLTVVAEGVETEQQKRFLREHACDEMQGFYFSKPLPASEFAAMLADAAPKAPASA